MSEKFLIDASKFEFNDIYIKNDLDILENVSPEVIKQIELLEPEPEPEPEQPEPEPTPEEEEIKPPIKKH